MNRELIKKLNNQSGMAISIIGSGALLLAYMIIVEDEPGAVPLLMILSGGAWLMFIKSRLKKLRKAE
jgi:hypothetical protein